MDTWFVIIVSICFAALIRSLLFRRRDGKKLPPGPSFLASNFLMLTSYGQSLKPIIGNLKSKYGPLITLVVGFSPCIFVGSQDLAHEILIQKGSVFSDRPTGSSSGRVHVFLVWNSRSATSASSEKLNDLAVCINVSRLNSIESTYDLREISLKFYLAEPDHVSESTKTEEAKEETSTTMEVVKIEYGFYD
ncbi:hypothetical protein L2E82_14085 [Cichorium intybus]|uniref:Uncharacterized protein n=1 Tax=Cichorium intybus TaxID=13427 RepID=A0ACB9EZ38_CICIN|nr:hypothetical protein L2E82_14085 [Cichorium intybus]